MSKYKCQICGNEFDTDSDEIKCNICGSESISMLDQMHDREVSEAASDDQSDDPLAYPAEYLIVDPDLRRMDDIHEMSVTNETIISAMGIPSQTPSWDEVTVLGGQLNPMPLMNDASVKMETIIGKNAAKPLVLASPVYVSHMSFGALSEEAKTALAKGSAAVKTAICSGEGGILPAEMENAYKYIFEYTPHEYSVSDESLKKVDAIEIKIGQGTKPGIGGHLPGAKVTSQIADIRGIEQGKDVIAPSKYGDINSREDLKAKVDSLRKRSEGRPIGIKIAAGHIEDDLEYCMFAGADFVTIDGRGGATAASPKLLRDATSIPTIYALHRARKYLDENNSDIDLIITGGLRVSSDFAKALAMGADAVAIASAALMSIGCQQYRLCNTGQCPMGIGTQDPELRKRLDVEVSAKRLENFLNVTIDELKVYARICGKDDIHDLDIDDLYTTSGEISKYTMIKHG